MKNLLNDVAQRSGRYLDNLSDQPVMPDSGAIERLGALGGPLPNQGMAPLDIVRALDDIAAPATIASAGPRYFGYVTGGALPASLAANWMAGAWDQNGFSVASSPVAAKIETIALDWLVDLFGLPAGSGGGFVTGATMANMSALAAARHHLLAGAGWNVEARGLSGAPPITVIVGGEVHVSLLKALGLIGLGRENVIRVPVDNQGRMIADQAPAIEGPTVICLQAGNVNTGAFDPAAEIIPAAQKAGAWVHVDGAFGIWAAVAPERAHLMAGYSAADSWATDAHKWLNAPYDSGIVLTRHPAALAAAMSVRAAYLHEDTARDPFDFTPECSRRMRGLEIWAALKSLGRDGLAEMIERNCRQAARFANGLRDAGYEILNDVVLNQVLVSFGTPEQTERTITAVQADGACWCGGAVWQGLTAMRISVSNWATTDEDVDRSLTAIKNCAAAN